jgi:hypothetical protein
MKTAELIKRHDAELRRAARPYQRLAEKHARELCEILAQHIGPVRLRQGMGGWNLDGEGKIPVTYSDDSKGTQSVSDFAWRHSNPDESRKYCETPDVPVIVLRTLNELRELCEWVNDPDTRGISPFNLSVP